jgi:hypothetical protein
MPLVRAVLCVLVFVSSVDVRAEFAVVKGEGVIDISGNKPSATEQRNAQMQAKEESITRYLSEFRESAASIYENCRMPEDQLNKVVIPVRIVRKSVDKDLGQYKVIMKNKLDVARLNRHLQSCGRQTERAMAFSKKRLAFALVARQAEEIRGTRTYREFFEQLDVALSKEFIDQNFNVDSGQDMEIFSGHIYRNKRLQQQYTHSGRVNWEPARIAGWMNEIDLLVIGYFDVGLPTRSESNGLIDISVTAKLQIFDMENNDVIAEVPSKEMSANGKTEQEAINAATRLVAQYAAEDLIDQLNLHGVGQ